jgi:hypothetical protein
VSLRVQGTWRNMMSSARGRERSTVPLAARTVAISPSRYSIGKCAGDEGAVSGGPSARSTPAGVVTGGNGRTLAGAEAEGPSLAYLLSARGRPEGRPSTSAVGVARWIESQLLIAFTGGCCRYQSKRAA